MKEVKIGDFKVGDGEKMLLIAGPCVIEDRDIVLRICDQLVKVIDNKEVQFVFKSSYDKANRTSINSFRGPGLDRGLSILKEVKDTYNVPIVTDVHCKHDVSSVAEIADIIQIPAFLNRQTDLIVEVAEKADCINLKKAQFISPHDVKYIVEKIESAGNRNILITERGSVFGYNRLVVDFCSIPILQALGYPVIMDATHSIQQPSSDSGVSGGVRAYAKYMAYAGIACQANGVFAEVHLNPEESKSDKSVSLSIEQLSKILDKLIDIYHIVNK